MIDEIDSKSNFIGKSLEIKSSKNQSLIGLCGTIVDETKFSFMLKCKDSKKIILKKDSVFLIDNTPITGELIIGTCTQRIKK
jgi:RNase P/RNase MRP subunit p29